MNLTNPYRSYKGTVIRLNLNAPLTDVQTIRSVLMQQGDLQTIWALLLQHLSSYVRTNNLTLNDRDQFITYVLSRLSESGLGTNSNPRHDGRTTERVRKVRSGAKNITATSERE